MREIKFRAWGKYGNNPHRMHYDDDITPLGDSENAMPGEVIRIVQDHYGWIFMQYTGLKDKNGVEIYEGDIIKDTRNGSIGFYDYSESHTAFAVRVKDEDDTGDFIIIDRLDGWYNINVEVIGNIHENFSLLEASNA